MLTTAIVYYANVTIADSFVLRTSSSFRLGSVLIRILKNSNHKKRYFYNEIDQYSIKVDSIQRSGVVDVYYFNTIKNNFNIFVLACDCEHVENQSFLFVLMIEYNYPSDCC